ncbi:MAG TPA: hypothetical protein VGO76_09595, partial [Luteibacter sp.]|nr:hypothetical protein [Luteibacter sp.]
MIGFKSTANIPETRTIVVATTSVTDPMSTRRERSSWLLILLLVGIASLTLRWFYVTHALVYQPADAPNARGDAVDYYRYAWNMVHRGVFSMASPQSAIATPDNYRDPGYPLLMAAWMKVFSQWDAWYAALLLSQAALGALTVVLLMQAGRQWLPKRWLIAAGIVMAVWPHS